MIAQTLPGSAGKKSKTIPSSATLALELRRIWGIQGQCGVSFTWRSVSNTLKVYVRYCGERGELMPGIYTINKRIVECACGTLGSEYWFQSFGPPKRHLLMSESESCSVVSDSLRPHGLYSQWNSLGQNTGVGSLSLLQGIFPTQGLNPDLLNCRWILYQLSHKGSPRILEWIAYPFSRGSSQPRDWTRVTCISCTCRWILYCWAVGKAPGWSF